MAKIVIAGDAVVVTSAMKLEDIKTIEKYRPKELVLKGGEDGKEPIFGVGTTHGAGSINAVGASFGSETRDDDKLACITLFLDGVTGDVKDWVADRLGAAIINLNKLESRPLPERDFEFMFYFDLETSVYSPQFQQLMGELPGLCEEFSYLGSYREVV